MASATDNQVSVSYYCIDAHDDAMTLIEVRNDGSEGSDVSYYLHLSGHFKNCDRGISNLEKTLDTVNVTKLDGILVSNYDYNCRSNQLEALLNRERLKADLLLLPKPYCDSQCESLLKQHDCVRQIQPDPTCQYEFSIEECPLCFRFAFQGAGPCVILATERKCQVEKTSESQCVECESSKSIPSHGKKDQIELTSESQSPECEVSESIPSNGKKDQIELTSVPESVGCVSSKSVPSHGKNDQVSESFSESEESTTTETLSSNEKNSNALQLASKKFQNRPCNILVRIDYGENKCAFLSGNVPVHIVLEHLPPEKSVSLFQVPGGGKIVSNTRVAQFPPLHDHQIKQARLHVTKGVTHFCENPSQIMRSLNCHRVSDMYTVVHSENNSVYERLIKESCTCLSRTKVKDKERHHDDDYLFEVFEDDHCRMILSVAEVSHLKSLHSAATADECMHSYKLLQEHNSITFLVSGMPDMEVISGLLKVLDQKSGAVLVMLNSERLDVPVLGEITMQDNSSPTTRPFRESSSSCSESTESSVITASLLKSKPKSKPCHRPRQNKQKPSRQKGPKKKTMPETPQSDKLMEERKLLQMPSTKVFLSYRQVFESKELVAKCTKPFMELKMSESVHEQVLHELDLTNLLNQRENVLMSLVTRKDIWNSIPLAIKKPIEYHKCKVCGVSLAEYLRCITAEHQFNEAKFKNITLRKVLIYVLGPLVAEQLASSNIIRLLKDDEADRNALAAILSNILDWEVMEGEDSELKGMTSFHLTPTRSSAFAASIVVRKTSSKLTFRHGRVTGVLIMVEDTKTPDLQVVIKRLKWQVPPNDLNVKLNFKLNGTCGVTLADYLNMRECSKSVNDIQLNTGEVLSLVLNPMRAFKLLQSFPLALSQCITKLPFDHALSIVNMQFVSGNKDQYGPDSAPHWELHDAFIRTFAQPTSVTLVVSTAPASVQAVELICKKAFSLQIKQGYKVIDRGVDISGEYTYQDHSGKLKCIAHFTQEALPEMTLMPSVDSDNYQDILHRFNLPPPESNFEKQNIPFFGIPLGEIEQLKCPMLTFTQISRHQPELVVSKLTWSARGIILQCLRRFAPDCVGEICQYLIQHEYIPDVFSNLEERYDPSLSVINPYGTCPEIQLSIHFTTDVCRNSNTISLDLCLLASTNMNAKSSTYTLTLTNPTTKDLDVQRLVILDLLAYFDFPIKSMLPSCVVNMLSKIEIRSVQISFSASDHELLGIEVYCSTKTFDIMKGALSAKSVSIQISYSKAKGINIKCQGLVSLLGSQWFPLDFSLTTVASGVLFTIHINNPIPNLRLHSLLNSPLWNSTNLQSETWIDKILPPHVKDVFRELKFFDISVVSLHLEINASKNSLWVSNSVVALNVFEHMSFGSLIELDDVNVTIDISKPALETCHYQLKVIVSGILCNCFHMMLSYDSENRCFRGELSVTSTEIQKATASHAIKNITEGNQKCSSYENFGAWTREVTTLVTNYLHESKFDSLKLSHADVTIRHVGGMNFVLDHIQIHVIDILKDPHKRFEITDLQFEYVTFEGSQLVSTENYHASETQASKDDHQAQENETQALASQSYASQTQGQESQARGSQMQGQESQACASQTQAQESKVRASQTQGQESQARASQTQGQESQVRASQTQGQESQARASQTQGQESQAHKSPSKAQERKIHESGSHEDKQPLESPPKENQVQQKQKTKCAVLTAIVLVGNTRMRLVFDFSIFANTPASVIKELTCKVLPIDDTKPLSLSTLIGIARCNKPEIPDLQMPVNIFDLHLKRGSITFGFAPFHVKRFDVFLTTAPNWTIYESPHVELENLVFHIEYDSERTTAACQVAFDCRLLLGNTPVSIEGHISKECVKMSVKAKQECETGISEFQDVLEQWPPRQGEAYKVPADVKLPPLTFTLNHLMLDIWLEKEFKQVKLEALTFKKWMIDFVSKESDAKHPELGFHALGCFLDFQVSMESKQYFALLFGKLQLHDVTLAGQMFLGSEKCTITTFICREELGHDLSFPDIANHFMTETDGTLAKLSPKTFVGKLIPTIALLHVDVKAKCLILCAELRDFARGVLYLEYSSEKKKVFCTVVLTLAEDFKFASISRSLEFVDNVVTITQARLMITNENRSFSEVLKIMSTIAMESCSDYSLYTSHATETRTPMPFTVDEALSKCTHVRSLMTDKLIKDFKQPFTFWPFEQDQGHFTDSLQSGFCIYAAFDIKSGEKASPLIKNACSLTTKPNLRDMKVVVVAKCCNSMSDVSFIGHLSRLELTGSLLFTDIEIAFQISKSKLLHDLLLKGTIVVQPKDVKFTFKSLSFSGRLKVCESEVTFDAKIELNGSTVPFGQFGIDQTNSGSQTMVELSMKIQYQRKPEDHTFLPPVVVISGRMKQLFGLIDAQGSLVLVGTAFRLFRISINEKADFQKILQAQMCNELSIDSGVITLHTGELYYSRCEEEYQWLPDVYGKQKPYNKGLWLDCDFSLLEQRFLVQVCFPVSGNKFDIRGATKHKLKLFGFLTLTDDKFYAGPQIKVARTKSAMELTISVGIELWGVPWFVGTLSFKNKVGTIIKSPGFEASIECVKKVFGWKLPKVSVGWSTVSGFEILQFPINGVIDKLMSLKTFLGQGESVARLAFKLIMASVRVSVDGKFRMQTRGIPDGCCCLFVWSGDLIITVIGFIEIPIALPDIPIAIKRYDPSQHRNLIGYLFDCLWTSTKLIAKAIWNYLSIKNLFKVVVRAAVETVKRTYKNVKSFVKKGLRWLGIGRGNSFWVLNKSGMPIAYCADHESDSSFASVFGRPLALKAIQEVAMMILSNSRATSELDYEDNDSESATKMTTADFDAFEKIVYQMECESTRLSEEALKIKFVEIDVGSRKIRWEMSKTEGELDVHDLTYHIKLVGTVMLDPSLIKLKETIVIFETSSKGIKVSSAETCSPENNSVEDALKYVNGWLVFSLDENIAHDLSEATCIAASVYTTVANNVTVLPSSITDEYSQQGGEDDKEKKLEDIKKLEKEIKEKGWTNKVHLTGSHCYTQQLAKQNLGTDSELSIRFSDDIAYNATEHQITGSVECQLLSSSFCVVQLYHSQNITEVLWQKQTKEFSIPVKDLPCGTSSGPYKLRAFVLSDDRSMQTEFVTSNFEISRQNTPQCIRQRTQRIKDNTCDLDMHTTESNMRDIEEVVFSWKEPDYLQLSNNSTDDSLESRKRDYVYKFSGKLQESGVVLFDETSPAYEHKCQLRRLFERNEIPSEKTVDLVLEIITLGDKEKLDSVPSVTVFTVLSPPTDVQISSPDNDFGIYLSWNFAMKAMSYRIELVDMTTGLTRHVINHIPEQRLGRQYLKGTKGNERYEFHSNDFVSNDENVFFVHNENEVSSTSEDVPDIEDCSDTLALFSYDDLRSLVCQKPGMYTIQIFSSGDGNKCIQSLTCCESSSEERIEILPSDTVSLSFGNYMCDEIIVDVRTNNAFASGHVIELYTECPDENDPRVLSNDLLAKQVIEENCTDPHNTVVKDWRYTHLKPGSKIIAAVSSTHANKSKGVSCTLAKSHNALKVLDPPSNIRFSVGFESVKYTENSSITICRETDSSSEGLVNSQSGFVHGSPLTVVMDVLDDVIVSQSNGQVMVEWDTGNLEDTDNAFVIGLTTVVANKYQILYKTLTLDKYACLDLDKVNPGLCTECQLFVQIASNERNSVGSTFALCDHTFHCIKAKFHVKSKWGLSMIQVVFPTLSLLTMHTFSLFRLHKDSMVMFKPSVADVQNIPNHNVTTDARNSSKQMKHYSPRFQIALKLLKRLRCSSAFLYDMATGSQYQYTVCSVKDPHVSPTSPGHNKEQLKKKSKVRDQITSSISEATNQVHGLDRQGPYQDQSQDSKLTDWDQTQDSNDQEQSTDSKWTGQVQGQHSKRKDQEHSTDSELRDQDQGNDSKGTDTVQGQDSKGTGPVQAQDSKGTDPVQGQDSKGTDPVQGQDSKGTDIVQGQDSKETGTVKGQDSKGTDTVQGQDSKEADQVQSKSPDFKGTDQTQMHSRNTAARDQMHSQLKRESMEAEAIETSSQPKEGTMVPRSRFQYSSKKTECQPVAKQDTTLQRRGKTTKGSKLTDHTQSKPKMSIMWPGVAKRQPQKGSKSSGSMKSQPGNKPKSSESKPVKDSQSTDQPESPAIEDSWVMIDTQSETSNDFHETLECQDTKRQPDMDSNSRETLTSHPDSTLVQGTSIPTERDPIASRDLWFILLSGNASDTDKFLKKRWKFRIDSKRVKGCEVLDTIPCLELVAEKLELSAAKDITFSEFIDEWKRHDKKASWSKFVTTLRSLEMHKSAVNILINFEVSLPEAGYLPMCYYDFLDMREVGTITLNEETKEHKEVLKDLKPQLFPGAQSFCVLIHIRCRGIQEKCWFEFATSIYKKRWWPREDELLTTRSIRGGKMNTDDGISRTMLAREVKANNSLEFIVRGEHVEIQTLLAIVAPIP